MRPAALRQKRPVASAASQSGHSEFGSTAAADHAASPPDAADTIRLPQRIAFSKKASFDREQLGFPLRIEVLSRRELVPTFLRA